MPQTSILTDPAIGVAGMIAYPLEPRSTLSKTVNQVGGIPFGVFVSRQADERIKLPAAAGDVTTTGSGFIHRDPTKEPDLTALGHSNGDEAMVLRRGYIWVNAEAAVTEEGLVYARITANGGLTQLGALRGDTDSGNATLVPNAKFVTSTTGAGLAIVEVR